MFGLEPDVLCERCAHGVRERYASVRGRSQRLRPPVVTALVFAMAAFTFVLVHVVKRYPPWLTSLIAGVEIWDGEVWRLLTTAFFHVNWLHILFNLWWMWGLGRGIEAAWGNATLALLVVGSAVAASAAEWIFGGAPGVGLSGVVYALAGFLYAQRRTHPVAAVLMHPAAANTLIGWFFACIVLTMTGTMPIANWAHGAGAVWGWLAGLAAMSPRRRLYAVALGLLVVALAAASPFVAFGDHAELRERYLAWREATR
jgi:membrane associated rhomboid family serine protease